MLIDEIVATYAKYGWRLQRLLLQPQTEAELLDTAKTLIDSVAVVSSSIDALWFSRPSHDNKEAWELRLLSATPYALFETFSADEPEEVKVRKRQEMETRLLEYAARKPD